MQAKYRVKATLGELELDCPPLPKTLLEAVELMNQPQGPEIRQVIEMVQHDPGVTARLLRVVNSAYYGQRSNVTSVQRAVIVLGTVSVTGIVMGMAMQDVENRLDERTTAPFLNLVRHSVATAYIGRLILSHDPGRPDDAMRCQELEGEVFTAALLHDFGKVILLYNHPHLAPSFFQRRISGSDADILKQERLVFGYDHAEAGVYLSRRLGFPEALSMAIAFHHRCDQVEEAAPLRQTIQVVSAANKAANALGFALNHQKTWAECSADPIWAQLITTGIVGYTSPEQLLDLLKQRADDVKGYVDSIS